MIGPKSNLVINSRYRQIISNLRKPCAHANPGGFRMISLQFKPSPLLVASINITMHTRLCQLNLFSNFPQDDRESLTRSPQ